MGHVSLFFLTLTLFEYHKLFSPFLLKIARFRSDIPSNIVIIIIVLTFINYNFKNNKLKFKNFK